MISACTTAISNRYQTYVSDRFDRDVAVLKWQISAGTHAINSKFQTYVSDPLGQDIALFEWQEGGNGDSGTRLAINLLKLPFRMADVFAATISKNINAFAKIGGVVLGLPAAILSSVIRLSAFPAGLAILAAAVGLAAGVVFVELVVTAAAAIVVSIGVVGTVLVTAGVLAYSYLSTCCSREDRFSKDRTDTEDLGEVLYYQAHVENDLRIQAEYNEINMKSQIEVLKDHIKTIKERTSKKPFENFPFKEVTVDSFAKNAEKNIQSLEKQIEKLEWNIDLQLEEQIIHLRKTLELKRNCQPEDASSQEIEIQSPQKQLNLKREFRALENRLAHLEQELKQRLDKRIERLTAQLQLKQNQVLETNESDANEVRSLEEQLELLKKNLETKKICMSEKKRSDQAELTSLQIQLTHLDQRLVPLLPERAQNQAPTDDELSDGEFLSQI
jgi:hypothetical protein